MEIVRTLNRWRLDESLPPNTLPNTAMLNADQLRQFADILESAAKGCREMADVAPLATPDGDARPGTPIRKCQFSARARKACAKMGVTTVEQLAEFTEIQAEAVRGVGGGTIRELRECLQKFGLDFSPH